MRTFLLILVIGAGIYFFANRRAGLQTPEGGAVTLEMRSEEVLKSHGKPAQLHTERGGREVWIYEDGRLVEFRDHEVIRSEPPGIGNTWVRLPDGTWVQKNAAPTTQSRLAKGAKGATPRGSAASFKAREQWGWDRQGTALDQPAKPAK